MSSHPLAEGVADLLHRPGARRAVRRSAVLTGLAVTASSVPPGAETTVDVMLEWVHDGVLATGQVSATWQGECRRCLKPVTGPLATDVQELFEPRPRDEDGYPLRHDQVDLEPMAREAVLLGLPLAPLCKEDCQGLCPRCGADLNEAACGHDAEQFDPRWAALDVLRQPQPSERPDR